MSSRDVIKMLEKGVKKAKNLLSGRRIRVDHFFLHSTVTKLYLHSFFSYFFNYLRT